MSSLREERAATVGSLTMLALKTTLTAFSFDHGSPSEATASLRAVTIRVPELPAGIRHHSKPPKRLSRHALAVEFPSFHDAECYLPHSCCKNTTSQVAPEL